MMLMSDTIEHIGKSLIQHGPSNDRVYVMKLYEQDVSAVLETIERLQEKYQYSKVFAKISSHFESSFLDRGFLREAAIPLFFDAHDAVFLGKFFTANRQSVPADVQLTVDNVLETARSKTTVPAQDLSDGNRTMRLLGNDDAVLLADLYRTVFPSYPFPIFDPAYLKETMAEHIYYYGVFENSDLIAASSAETDPSARAVEMTDFATLPKARGSNTAGALLNLMEIDMAEKGFRCAYTIARSVSYGMNCTFSKAGYQYGGTLKNNTHISGSIECMNVWYKRL